MRLFSSLTFRFIQEKKNEDKSITGTGTIYASVFSFNGTLCALYSSAYRVDQFHNLLKNKKKLLKK